MVAVQPDVIEPVKAAVNGVVVPPVTVTVPPVKPQVFAVVPVPVR